MINNINIQKHEIKPTGKILDIASGHHPFVREGLDVTYIDKYPDKNVSRRSDLVQPGKEVMQMDVEDMSFEDGEFDYSVCFPIGTMISGCNKEIETIRVGDTVLGENGQHQKVINTFKRKFNGKLVYIKPLGIEATKVTPEHKILTTTFRRIHRQNNLKGKGNIYEWVRGGLIWKQAKDIKKRDYLLIPRNKKSEEYEFELRIGRGKFNGSGDYRKPQKFTLNNNIAIIFGLWFAEGIVTHIYAKRKTYKNMVVTFCLGSHEHTLIGILCDLLNQEFGFSAYVQKSGSSTTITVCNKDFAKFLLESIGKGAKNKRVPDFILNAPSEIVESFIEGWFFGDGDKNGNVLRISSISKLGIFGLTQLLIKLGRTPSVYREKRTQGIIKGRVVHQYDRLSVQIKNKDKFSISRCDNNYVYLPVNKTKQENATNGYVYNIQTEDSRYCVPFIVHNCGDILEHCNDPMTACEEIMRVSKAGWVRCPTMLWECLFGREYHFWTTNLIDDTLIFYPIRLYFKRWGFPALMKNGIHQYNFRPEVLHASFEWEDSFKYKVLRMMI